MANTRADRGYGRSRTYAQGRRFRRLEVEGGEE
jgi:hypothetical protein